MSVDKGSPKTVTFKLDNVPAGISEMFDQIKCSEGGAGKGWLQKDRKQGRTDLFSDMVQKRYIEWFGQESYERFIAEHSKDTNHNIEGPNQP